MLPYNEDMTSELLQENLYWSLLLVAMRAKHSLLRLAEKHDLSLMQMVTLCSIETDGSMYMNSISGLLSCDASNVTGIIDRLLAQGLIVREENAQDRRRKSIALTPKGEMLKQKILAELQTHESRTLENLSREQKRDLLKIVQTALAPAKSAK